MRVHSCYSVSLAKVLEPPIEADELHVSSRFSSSRPNESPLRHQLVTDQRLLRYYLMRPSLRPIFGDFGGSFPRS